MLKTIKSKFILASVIFILISVGIPAWILILEFRENFKERSMMMMETSLDIMNTSIHHAMMEKEKHIAKILSSHLTENINVIRILNPKGTIKFSTNLDEIGDNLLALSSHSTTNLHDSTTTLISDEAMYSRLIPIKNSLQCHSCHNPEYKDIGYIDLDFHLSEAENNFYTGVNHTVYLAIAVILFLITGLFFIFGYFINNPLQKLMNALEEVKKGNLKVRLNTGHDDEFGAVDNHFNNMVGQMEKSMTEIEQFHFMQLQRADKLVTLGELASEMAHEINNPTGVIMTRADFLKLEFEENASLKRFNDDIDVIINQADKIAQITKSVLKYSRKRQTDFEVMDLNSAVETAVKLFKHSLEKRNIKIEILTENNNNPSINGNPQQIEQIITNLLNNSIDAVERNATIGVCVKQLEDGRVQLSIKDDGPGIDPALKEQIFLPFFSTKSNKNGTGLGLYIVKKICHTHNADIQCVSAANEGTEFIINFNQVNND